MKKADLPILSTANQLLAEFIPNLTVSYHPVTKLACYIHYYIELIHVFKSNGYPENFTNNCFEVFLDNKYRIQEQVITVPKKTLFLVLPYLGPLSLQTRTKLSKSLKGILNCCKLQSVFKSQKGFSF